MRNSRSGRKMSSATTLPIYSLSGGVGRQAPSKRLPQESQELENALITVERSLEKRPGVELLPFKEAGSTTYTAENLPIPDSNSLEFFWHALSDEARYLFVVDRNATGATDQLYYVFFFNQTLNIFENHTPTTHPPSEVRAYIVYSPASPLKFVAKGQNLLFLNTEVEAGYTSKYSTTNSAWETLNLDGTLTGTVDVQGGEVIYTTALKVDPDGIAIYWTEFDTYLAGTTVLYIKDSVTDPHAGGGHPHDNGLNYSRSTLLNCFDSTTQPFTAGTGHNEAGHPDNDQHWTIIADQTDTTLPRYPKQIPVKDWKYPDSTEIQLGQALPTFADIQFPPPDADVTAGNNGAQDMLVALYGLTKDPTVTGFDPLNSAEGKVYYVESGYLGEAPGYYIMKSTSAPHSMKIRTPDAYSVFAQERMPMELEFVGGAVGSQWSWSTIEWTHRTSGTLETNPGPEPFSNGGTAKLSNIAFFRNRLWLSSGDNVFSSRSGNFSDFWIEDPGLIVDTDPIDVQASSNKYTPITSMVPFNEYMFINTNADTQYELLGSENQITPFTAELQPMTFYSTAPLTDPQTLGNNIFFYDRERLYLYVGRGGTLSTAIELSQHCPRYLPIDYGPIAVAAAQDTIIAVDGRKKSDLYLYTTRYRGESVLQNAFYRYSIEGADIQSLRSWDNYLYMVNLRGTKYTIERLSMRNVPSNIPRLDRSQDITLAVGGTLGLSNPKYDSGAFNAIFDANENATTIRLPFINETMDYVVLGEGFGVNSGTILKALSITPDPNGLFMDVVLTGNRAINDATVYVGQSYVMLVQLSTQFLRDPNNNPTEGVLNLASMSTRHFETGNYDIVVQRRGYNPATLKSLYENRLLSPLADGISTFTAARSDTFAESDLPLNNIDYQGELVSKILGFSDKTEIFIMSDYPTPVNITNIEIKGKFKQTYSSIL